MKQNAEGGGAAGGQTERSRKYKHTPKSRPEGSEFSESLEANLGNVRALTKLKRQILKLLLRT